MCIGVRLFDSDRMKLIRALQNECTKSYNDDIYYSIEQ